MNLSGGKTWRGFIADQLEAVNPPQRSIEELLVECASKPEEVRPNTFFVAPLFAAGLHRLQRIAIAKVSLSRGRALSARDRRRARRLLARELVWREDLVRLLEGYAFTLGAAQDVRVLTKVSAEAASKAMESSAHTFRSMRVDTASGESLDKLAGFCDLLRR